LVRFFEEALKQELSRSTRYVPRYTEGAKGKFEFHIDLNTVDVADSDGVFLEEFKPFDIHFPKP